MKTNYDNRRGISEQFIEIKKQQPVFRQAISSGSCYPSDIIFFFVFFLQFAYIIVWVFVCVFLFNDQCAVVAVVAVVILLFS